MSLKLDAISINCPDKYWSVFKVIDRYMRPRHVVERKSRKKFQFVNFASFQGKTEPCCCPISRC